jgi:hypothetical protein
MAERGETVRDRFDVDRPANRARDPLIYRAVKNPHARPAMP